MIDRTKLPDFLQEMPVERLRELMEIDNNSGNFNKAMDKMLHTDKKKKAKSRARTKSSLAISLRFCVLD